MIRVDEAHRETEGESDAPQGAPRPLQARHLPFRGKTVGLVVIALSSGLGCSGTESDPGSQGSPGIDLPVATAQEALTTANKCITLRREPGRKAFDAFVNEEKPATTYGALGFANVNGTLTTRTRALFKFDLSPIPAGATILSAGLSVSQTNTGLATVRAHAVLTPWNEATVTWNSIGASFGAPIASVSNATATMVFPVTAQVQAWVQGTQANQGFLLDQLPSTTTRFYTQEWVLAPQRPYLSVCYNVVCAPGFADCDNDPQNGCEANLASPSSCGACGNTCSSANGAATCTAGTCGLSACNLGFGNCDGNPQNGCETSLSSLTDCGACGTTCSLPGASSVCIASACNIGACNAGLADCDGNAQNGCEADLTSLTSCGACGISCTFAHAAASCSAGACMRGACDAGFADCDGDAQNGCETDLGAPESCGACGTACSFANATAGCVDGGCALSACNAGFANCDGDAQSGCETPLGTVTNCGGCGNTCSFTNASAVCAAGTCKLGACNAGTFDCDSNAQNGCEPMPCASGSLCAADAGCASQICVGGVCAAHACNDHVKNGGETDTDCGGATCGGCADSLACQGASDCASQVCTNAVCQPPTCADGVQNGGETATDSGGPCSTPWRSALYPSNWTPDFTTQDGLFLHDFSYAGYHRSEIPLPSSWPGTVVDVTTKNAHPNTAQDSRAAFVAAINAVVAAGGGVVYVPDGEYIISSPITINASNILIRGQSRASTKIFFSKIPNSQSGFIFKGAVANTNRVALAVDGVSRSKDVYVADASSFTVGNDVLIDIIITQAFINEHQMSGIWDAATNSALGVQRDFFRRTITAIDTSVSPNKITVDVPLRYPVKVRDSAAIRLDTGALKEVGIEHLSVNNVATAAAAAANPRAHVFWFERVQDGYVYDVGTYASARAAVQTHYLQSGGVYIVASKRMTVANTTMEHAQNHGDGGAGYAFEASMSNEILFRDDVASDVRHAFTQNWDFGASGLVFLRCDANDNIAVNPTFSTPGTSEYHHRLAIACLFDSTHDSSGFMAINRLTESSNAGHTATENVFWNVSGSGPDAIVRSYQFGMGYIIGTTNSTPRVVPDFIDAFFGVTAGTEPTDYLEGQNTGPYLTPSSLFEDQLARRLNP